MRASRSVLALCLWGCTTAPAPAVSPRDQALLGVKTYIDTALADLETAATALCAAAPAADADGWNAKADAAAVNAMKAQWKLARSAYERVEGAIAVLFPDLDFASDQRYEGFLAQTADDDLFDGDGVTGIHAIERILWSDQIAPTVLAFETALPGYVTATFPENLTQATEFKTKLCARLVTDVKAIRSQFAPLALDPAAAYRGVIGSMMEQIEKVEKVASGEEESRYAQYTLADMRTNVQAGVATYQFFQPWLLAQTGGAAADQAIAAGFARILAAYAKIPGDAVPAVPPTWSSEMPSMADLQSAFGQLWQVLRHEADPKVPDSLVAAMNHSADLLAIPKLP